MSSAHEAILLLDHGSRDPDAKIEFDEIARALQARVDLNVYPAFLELAEPPVLDQLEALARAGVQKVWGLSAFLLPAGHVKSDLPTALTEAKRDFGIEIEYGKPLGLHPSLLFALRERLREARANLPQCENQEVAVLVVGRGASDPDANSEVAKLARLMYEGGECGYAHTAFVSIAKPSVAEGLAQCAALGAKQIILLPFFLCTGLLIQRIQKQAEEWAVARDDVQVAVASHLGAHPQVIDALVDRLGELRLGENRSIWCDRCKFRAPLPGHEHSVGAALTSDDAHGLRHSHSHGHTHAHDLNIIARATGVELRGDAITKRSFEIIEAELRSNCVNVPQAHLGIIKRVIHTTADFEYAELLQFSERAIEAGRTALDAQSKIICDVRMVQSGLTKLGERTLCFVDDPNVWDESNATGETRSVLGLRKALMQAPNAIVVIGNAPTALWETLRLVDAGKAKPLLIIGVPVGFVDAVESKAALGQRADVEWIITRGRKGGSGVAAAIVNALIREYHE